MALAPLTAKEKRVASEGRASRRPIHKKTSYPRGRPTPDSGEGGKKGGTEHGPSVISLSDMKIILISGEKKRGSCSFFLKN